MTMRHLETTAVTAFTDELRQSLPEILTALDAAERDPSDSPSVHEAYRLVHALKGAASMVGLAALGYLLNQAEELLENAASGLAPLSDDVLDLLRASIPRFAEYTEAALAGRPIEPIAMSLARSLRHGGADGALDDAALRQLLDIDARELASWKSAEAAAAAKQVAAAAPVVERALDEAAPDASEAFAFADPPEPAFPGEPHPLVTDDTPVSVAFDEDAVVPRDEETVAAALDEEQEPQRDWAAVESAEPDLDMMPAEAIPQELAEIFAEEAHEHLQAIARLTSQLGTTPGDRDALQDLRRSVHTLKGAAGVVGYKGASRLAHKMEDLLDRLYDGVAVMTPDAVHVLASSSDALDDLIAGVPDPSALRETVARLFAQFDALAGAAARPYPQPFPQDDAAAVEAEMAAQMAAATLPAPPPAQAPERRAAAVAPVAPEPEVPTGPMPARDEGLRVPERRRSSIDRRGGGQMLRIPFQRLNDLVRLVSDLVINRSTFEQHYAALIEQVDELKLSTARLKRVAQKLEADYEVRGLAGHMEMTATTGFRAAGSGGHDGFDELELDRYTDFHLLTRELTETASDIATVSARVGDTVSDFDGDLTGLGRVTHEVQDKIMEFRMVPLSTLAARLERAVRVTAEECGKVVDFALEGEHVSLDKMLLEEMADPLLHLLRNAVDHGIEAPAIRQAAGKSPRGRISVRAYHQGTDVLIEVQDDGGGLNLERIRSRAVERGYVSEAESAVLTHDALFAFVFEPGFSTASRISEVSGRGVGLDIVKWKVMKVNGRIHLTSSPATGTTVAVRVPMTMAVTRILLVRTGGQTIGLPLAAVAQIVRPYASAITKVGNQRVVTVDGHTYPLRDLADTLGLPRSADLPRTSQPVLIANLGGRRIALAVDEIAHSRDAVVKSLGTHLRRVHGIWGATLLGDGTVVLILNTADLGDVAEDARARRPAARAVTLAQEVYTVLVVDDSLSMRHVLSTAVKKAGWIPIQARDGLEALEIVHRASPVPDLILLDIEMPRMDGYEFLSTIRAQKGHGSLPIVMLTSRGGDKHREKAKALGATEYMVKPFHEDVIVQTIDRLVRAARQGDRREAS